MIETSLNELYLPDKASTSICFVAELLKLFTCSYYDPRKGGNVHSVCEIPVHVGATYVIMMTENMERHMRVCLAASMSCACLSLYTLCAFAFVAIQQNEARSKESLLWPLFSQFCIISATLYFTSNHFCLLYCTLYCSTLIYSTRNYALICSSTSLLPTLLFALFLYSSPVFSSSLHSTQLHST